MTDKQIESFLTHFRFLNEWGKDVTVQDIRTMLDPMAELTTKFEYDQTIRISDSLYFYRVGVFDIENADPY